MSQQQEGLGVPASSGGRACALRAEPAAQSQAEPLVPNAGPFRIVHQRAKPRTEAERLRERIFYAEMDLKSAESLAKSYADKAKALRRKIKADKRALAKAGGEA